MAQSFKSDQLKKSRVKVAYTNTRDSVQKRLTSLRINLKDVQIYLRAMKMEKDLEVWVKHKDSSSFQLFKTYKFCVLSGNLGPKTKQGDLQVPEGYYHIDRFNPWSTFHLSLGINYPNLSDKRRNSGNLGGDIFIHGDCVSIGCIPITDEFIEELYVLAVEAKNNGQSKIPVHIFPFRMTDNNMAKANQILKDGKLQSFWENLKEGYQKFQSGKRLFDFKTNTEGKYVYE